LQILNDLEVHNNSTALFIVSGDVEIAKGVVLVDVGIIADGNIYTAYDIVEGDSTQILQFRGFFICNDFVFQRTLVGTSNSDFPSEEFTYEPKYITQLQGFFGAHHIIWRSTD